MRIGYNPAKYGTPAHTPRPLGVAILSCIPSRDGYFAESLEILHYQILSLHATTTSEFDLYVFDNGSCSEVQQQLLEWKQQALIDFLFLSNKNLGKINALNWILSSLPNEWICYADGDILFRPGWWEKSLEILRAFPEAGAVTAYPCFYDALQGESQAVEKVRNQPDYTFLHVLPDERDVREYAHSINLPQHRLQEILQTPITIVEYRDSPVRAIVGASHMQFVISKEVARKLTPIPSRYAISTEEDVRLNRQIDSLGLLHLSTLKPYLLHMGNHLDEITMSVIKALGLDQTPKHTTARTLPIGQTGQKTKMLRLLRYLARWSWFERMLRRVYNFLFEFFAS